MAAIRRARVVLLEVNPNVPSPTATAWYISPPPALVDEERRSGDRPAAQQAIGQHARRSHRRRRRSAMAGIPDAVRVEASTSARPRHPHRCWSDGILSLIGIWRGHRDRPSMPGRTIANSRARPRRLYRSMHRNPASRCTRWSSPTTLRGGTMQRQSVRDQRHHADRPDRPSVRLESSATALTFRAPAGRRISSAPPTVPGRQGLIVPPSTAKNGTGVADRTGAVAGTHVTTKAKRHQPTT